MTPHSAQLLRAREQRHAAIWADLLKRVRAVREKAVHAPEDRKPQEVRR